MGTLSLTGQRLSRAIEPLPDATGWLVQDECIGKDGRPIDFTVRWQFAPETRIKRLGDRRFLLKRHDVQIELDVSAGWSEVILAEIDALPGASSATPDSASLEGFVSPAFRQIVRAPYLKLVARSGGQPRVFTTTFLA